MSEYIVGLRGGIGTGKSTVSDLFAARGVTVADADVSARRVVEPGQPAYERIVEAFGSEVLQENGQLDRARLRSIVFADDEKRRFLERQTQGPIVADLLQIVREARSPYAILVLSTGTGKVMGMNRLLVVDAPVEIQIARVMARDSNSREQVEAIIAAQPPREIRVADADDLIINDGDPAHLAPQVDALHERYCRLSREAAPGA